MIVNPGMGWDDLRYMMVYSEYLAVHTYLSNENVLLEERTNSELESGARDCRLELDPCPAGRLKIPNQLTAPVGEPEPKPRVTADIASLRHSCASSLSQMGADACE